MPPRAAPEQSPEQTPEEIGLAVESFLSDHPGAALLEDGKLLFDLRTAKYSLTTEHDRCTLHLWSEERNLVRRVVAATERNKVLKLATQRFGQARAQTLELVADKDRRTPSTREATRNKFALQLTRLLSRTFPEWKAEAFRTAMDLEKSFGPAYARGSLVRGSQGWAVIAVNEEESQGTVDGILTLGILWLRACREQAGGRRLYQGLKIVVPKGMGALTRSRLNWLNPDAAKWELYELDQRAEELAALEVGDQGNLSTRLVHAPDETAAKERFASATARILSLVPATAAGSVEQRLRVGTEKSFLLHGLEFARVRLSASPDSFNRVEEISFGAGASETPLTAENEPALRHLVGELFRRRTASGDHRDALFRMAPERWLESLLHKNLESLDAHLQPSPVYTQVPAFAAADRGMLDLLGVSAGNRLAVLELKANEDLHLALQGLDYWVRVRWHHVQPPDPASGLGEFQRHGYFPAVQLSRAAPMLYLVAPALRIHPATEVVLRYLSPAVEWQLLALDERWRGQIKVVWRKRSGDLVG